MEVISYALFCSGLAVDWMTFTIDFHGLLMMYSNVLGPRCRVPSIKIPNPSSMATELFLVDLEEACKDSYSQDLIRNCCAAVLSPISTSFVAESASLLEHDCLLCSLSMLLV